MSLEEDVFFRLSRDMRKLANELAQRHRIDTRPKEIRQQEEYLQRKQAEAAGLHEPESLPEALICVLLEMADSPENQQVACTLDKFIEFGCDLCGRKDEAEAIMAALKEKWNTMDWYLPVNKENSNWKIVLTHNIAHCLFRFLSYTGEEKCPQEEKQ